MKKSDFKTSFHLSRNQFNILLKIKLIGPSVFKTLSENEKRELPRLEKMGFIACFSNNTIRLDANTDACLSRYFAGVYELMRIIVHNVSSRAIRYSRDKTLEVLAKQDKKRCL